ncbi:hypothetical protein KDA_67320 [Dictyobacter alpinus]|uniref:Uncharacterized protein n=2 Tax=Dictyobacter alpinus TaxID=2014873 RepID=A0A402BIL9_9CHLR|nr:hypothetical protein KDA_67320 [Dictyobacter alpinus]
MYSPWENIATITTYNAFRFSAVLVLREPASRTLSFSEGVRRKEAVIERRSLLMDKYGLLKLSYTMPFLSYLPKKEWEGGALQAYFQLYAPHLLEN